MVALNLAGVEVNEKVVKDCAIYLRKNVEQLSRDEQLVLSEVLERSDSDGLKHMRHLADSLKV